MLLFNRFIKKIKNLKKNISGTTAIEYGLIAALIAVVIIGSITAVGTSIQTKFNGVASSVNSVNTQTGG